LGSVEAEITPSGLDEVELTPLGLGEAKLIPLGPGEAEPTSLKLMCVELQVLGPKSQASDSHDMPCRCLIDE